MRSGGATSCYVLGATGPYYLAVAYHLMAAEAPREFGSGTSVRGKARLTKMGGGLIRSKLFLSGWSARNANTACRALYDHLVAKGKNGKLALIAVCHELLKQDFEAVY